MQHLLFETLTLYNSIDLLLILKSSRLADFSLIFALDFSVVTGLVFHSPEETSSLFLHLHQTQPQSFLSVLKKQLCTPTILKKTKTRPFLDKKNKLTSSFQSIISRFEVSLWFFFFGNMEHIKCLRCSLIWYIHGDRGRGEQFQKPEDSDFFISILN